MNLTFFQAMRFLKSCTMVLFVFSAVICDSMATDSQLNSSVIDSVIVYPDGAKVSRSSTVDLEAGENIIRFDFLPNQIDSASFKVLLPEVENAWLRDFGLKTNQRNTSDYEPLAKLISDLEDLNKEKLVLVRQMEMQDQRVKYAQKISDSFTEGYGQKEGDLPSVEMIDQTWSFYEQTVRMAEEVRDALAEKLKPVEKSIKVLEQKIEKVSASAKQLGNSVEVYIDSQKTQKISIQLEYLARNCNWKPVYEVRAFPSVKDLAIRYQADISQQTGEDWNDVMLTLSVSRASDWGNVDELYPIRLNKIEPAPVFERSARMVDEAEPAMVYSMSPLQKSAPVFSSTYSSFSVQLPDRFTVESGSGSKKALVAEFRQSDVDFWTEIVPSSDERGFLIASTENDFQFPMLMGTAVVFVDGQLMGKSFFDEYAVGANFEVSLGVNKNVQVERKKGKLNESDRGVFGKKTKLVRQYFTTVENVGQHVLQLKIKDQFPISENEKIVVNGISPDANTASFEENTGIFTWETKLEPASSKVFETKFEVVFPEDWDIPTHF